MMKRGQGAFSAGPNVRNSYARAREKLSKRQSGSNTVGWTLLLCTLIMVTGLYFVQLHLKNQVGAQNERGNFDIGRGNEGGKNNSKQTRLRSVSSQSTEAIKKPFTDANRMKALSSSVKTSSKSSTDVVTLGQIEERLRSCPYHEYIKSHIDEPLEEVLVYLHSRPECRDKPIFTSMANVGSEMYWQLIENFVYTMAKYNLADCTLMICVSDPHCIELCRASNFPCFDYRHQVLDDSGNPVEGNREKVHTMEQIAQLKLFIMPKALLKGVDIFMLDLDVGFLDDPMKLVSKFYQSGQHLDAFVQEDVVFIMNRSVSGWKQWWTEKMPNIGLFLVRGNKKSSSVFESAWNDYKANTPKKIRMNPGKDQNKVVQAMRLGRWRTGFTWGYIPNNTAVLIDKVFKFEDMGVELGGEASGAILSGRGAVAVHTTCYEQKSKIMGLKAANAFWNPKYYDPQRRTLTKKIIYTTPRTVIQEVRALAYLALRSNRTLIIPNLLAAPVSDQTLLRAEDKRSNKVQRPMYRNQTLWPGFRVLYLKTKGANKNGEPFLHVEVVEPSFYWRLRKDYASPESPVPEPHIMSYPESITIKKLESSLMSAEHDSFPRAVLHIHAPIGALPTTLKQDLDTLIARQKSWADDSVGTFLDFADETLFDRKLPELDVAEYEPETEETQRLLAGDVIRHTRLCANILDRMKGNRSCFDKCS